MREDHPRFARCRARARHRARAHESLRRRQHRSANGPSRSASAARALQRTGRRATCAFSCIYYLRWKTLFFSSRARNTNGRSQAGISSPHNFWNVKSIPFDRSQPPLLACGASGGVCVCVRVRPEPKSPEFPAVPRKIIRARAIKKPPVFAFKHENRFKRRSIAARAAQKPGVCLRKTPGFALNEPRTKPRAAKTSSLLRGIELFPCSTGGTTKRW